MLFQPERPLSFVKPAADGDDAPLLTATALAGFVLLLALTYAILGSC